MSKRIAILGATGYIGRSLLASSSAYNFKVVPFSRDVARAKSFFGRLGLDIETDIISNYDNFLTLQFDVVINATGIGSMREVASAPRQVFGVTESIDNLLVSYLEKHPDSRVFSISSGSVFGLSARQPITTDSLATFNPADFNPGDFYSLAKLYSEAKHRAVFKSHIVDLRVFVFVSLFLDIEEPFFISEITKCLKTKEIFKTKSEDMMRDYTTAEDIWDVIELLMKLPPQNTAFDMRSQSPVSKFELLDHLRDQFGLKYQVDSNLSDQSPTGSKSAYYSRSDALFKLGFKPAKTALQNIEFELSAFLEENKA